MKIDCYILLILLAILFDACTPAAPAPTPTTSPSPTPLPTTTPVPTLTPTPAPVWVTLGSPFDSDCGDGIPRIWSNDSFNGPFKSDGFGSTNHDSWGHVDIFAPKGCSVMDFSGEFISPVSGNVSKYIIGEGEFDFGFRLELPEGVFLNGLEKVFIFSGIDNFDIKRIEQITVDFGHVDSIEGKVEKGQSLGEIIPCCSHEKIGYQIGVIYSGKEYMFSPTLFEIDGSDWPCVENSPYDCEPEPHDYAP